MRFKAKAISNRLFWLALALVGFSLFSFQVLGGVNEPDTKTIPPSSYELRFLGCKLNKANNNKTHIGIFVFTWKGQNPVKILTSPDDKKVFYPYPDLRVHEGADWATSGGVDDSFGWATIQPGQVITFSIGMGTIDMAMGASKGDKACLVLHSKGGEIVSDEFPLPLLPAIEK